MSDTASSSSPMTISPIEGIGGFWRAIGGRAVGASVVTATGAEGPEGFLALSPTHLCADPPTVMVSVDSRTTALGAVTASGHLAINYLSEGQVDLLASFGGKTEAKGSARFDGLDWQPLPSGAPALAGAVCVLDCAVEEMIERHGTQIVLARILGATAADGAPLVLYKGKPYPSVPAGD